MADWRWGSYRRMWQLQGNVELPGGGQGCPSRDAESAWLNATTALSIRDHAVPLDVSWLFVSSLNDGVVRGDAQVQISPRPSCRRSKTYTGTGATLYQAAPHPRYE
jgi:hypothetical protein